MGSHVSKKGLYISTAVYSLLVLILSVWSSYFIHIAIYAAPLGLTFIYYRWAFLHDIAFSENKYVRAIIIGSLVCLLTVFILFPIIEILRNNLYINIVNFIALYKSKGFLFRVFGLAVIMLAIYIGLFILAYRSQNEYESIFDSIDRTVFKENVDAIITYLKGKEATSAITAIPKAAIFNNKALNFLVKKRIIIKTNDKKYYLRRTALKDLEDKVDLKFDIIFFVCIFLLYGLVFTLIGQTNKVNGPVNYIIKASDYTYTKPKEYVVTVGTNSSSTLLFPKKDVTGNSGVIYVSVINISTPSEISNKSEIDSLKNKYSSLSDVQDYNNEAYTNIDGNYVISNTMRYKDHIETADYIYLKNKSGLCEKVVLVESRYFDTDSSITTDIKNVVNSVDNLLN